VGIETLSTNDNIFWIHWFRSFEFIVKWTKNGKTGFQCNIELVMTKRGNRLISSYWVFRARRAIKVWDFLMTQPFNWGFSFDWGLLLKAII
jgi:hypothetical protein